VICLWFIDIWLMDEIEMQWRLRRKGKIFLAMKSFDGI
jgi:hypothetical protein